MRAAPALLLLLSAILSAVPTLALASSRVLPPVLGAGNGQDLGKEMNKPGIGKIEEPDVDCVREISGHMKDNDVQAARAAGVQNISKKCLPQMDAYKRAAEASSYLGHYLMNFTPFAQDLHLKQRKDELQKYQDTIRECVSGQRQCTQDEQLMVMKAMVQYNFGKEIRAQVVENQARADRMKTASSDLPAEYWRAYRTNAQRVMTHKGALKAGGVRKNTFRVNPVVANFADPANVRPNDLAQLGQNFMHDYNTFLDSYEKTTAAKSRWHYVAAKGTGETYVPQVDHRNVASKDRLRVDGERLDSDQRSQNSQHVNEIVKNFRESMRQDLVPVKDADGKTQMVKPSQVALREVGLGLLDDGKTSPKDMAATIVVSINKAITDKEEQMAKKDERKPSSPGVAKAPMVPSVTVDLERFDQFLNAIWPPEVDRPKTP